MYPILFEFGFITIFSLWFFIAVGFIAGAFVFIRLSKRYRVKLSVIFDNSFALFLWTLVISRLAFVATNLDLYFYKFQMKNLFGLVAIWDKGLSFWGAIFAWFSGIWYFSRKNSESPWRLFDIMLPALFIDMFFGNIGAFLEGINYGTPTSLPWGMTFRSANVKYISNIHPTQLYGALYMVLIALGLFVLLRRMRNRAEGLVAEIGVLVFSLFKFLEEFLRGDEMVKILSMRLPQIVAMLGLIVAGYLIYKRYANYTKNHPGLTVTKLIGNLIKKHRKPDSSEMVIEGATLQSRAT